MDPLTVAGVIASLVFGLAGVIVGIIGLVGSRRANALARDANRIAGEANATSRESLAQVQAADARALEDHVVEWAWGWDAGRLFWVRNDGRHTARAAFVRVNVDGITENVDQPLDVAPRGVVRLQFDEAQEAWKREVQARASHQPVERSPGITFFRGAYKAPQHDVRVQIWWRTDLGTARDFEATTVQSFKSTDP